MMVWIVLDWLEQRPSPEGFAFFCWQRHIHPYNGDLHWDDWYEGKCEGCWHDWYEGPRR